MVWKPLGFRVEVDAEVRAGSWERVHVVEFDSTTRAIRVLWPAVDSGAADGEKSAVQPRTEVPAAGYRLLDSRAWDDATRDL